MLALYRAGRQVEALEVYRETRAALVDAFGVEPGAELVRLEQAILRHDPELPPEAAAAPTAPERCSSPDATSPACTGSPGWPRRSRDGPATSSSSRCCWRRTRAWPARRPRSRPSVTRSAEPMRVAAFVSRDEPADVLRLARTYDAGLVLVEAPPGFAEGRPPPDELVELLARSPADVAVVALGAGPGRASGGVIVPFGGGEHDWAAVELGAVARGGDRRAAAPRGHARGERRDASRLLADASMAVQRLVGVVAEPLLVEPSATGLAEAAADARRSWSGSRPAGATRASARRGACSRPPTARRCSPSTAGRGPAASRRARRRPASPGRSGD